MKKQSKTRVTSKTREFAGGFLAEIFLDGYRTDKQMFYTKEMAEKWSQQKMSEKRVEIGLEKTL